MIAQQIKQKALSLFAAKGYDATSLDLIAAEVGRKKPTLYSHFSGKEQLFLAVFNEAIQGEIQYLDDFYARHRQLPFDEVLFSLIASYKERYTSDDNLKLILYHGFIIPQVHEDTIKNALNTYFEHKEQLARGRFAEAASQLAVDIDSAVLAYSNLLEGMLVELIYAGPDRFDRRLASSWQIFMRGILQACKDKA
ncbi:AcrR family transcriptional regulator [Paenibacillus phyllosphaerae]|uniref:AcrR family transcriptional regulator n=1 Tax=Paenibacillus phyllosphaerae TaxID=274593 RepID=A0A7W5B117_9BACL|nr:TetR/AcrR family transcriptional regulator [Paenibacillus phyllosphaerae]MBB3112470.1 AcrR family transcriptional regulator [Paenibacillus phyllosphaerae]